MIKKSNPFLKVNLNLAVLILMVFILSPGLFSQEITPDLYKNLRYRHIGPSGNRASAVVGEPGNPLVYYVGAASGGVWKSTDGGFRWKPVFDKQPVQSIGALAITPSNHKIIWAGTGEAFIRSNVSIGNGVYKSVNGGKTWKHMGLEKTGRIGRVLIHPQNPDIVFVAALGHCYGPQKERGVYKTTDGGKSWKKVLFADENTGCFEIVMVPGNPELLFAGMWPLVIKTHTRESGGPRGGLYRSTDGGESWKKLSGRGLPKPPIGKVGIAVSHSNPSVIYTIMETGAPNRGVLWKSSNKGKDWKLISYDRILNERPHYASRIMVNPADENLVYFAANSFSITKDGGKTTGTTFWSGDSHDLWADPKLPDRMMISDDGGATITIDRGKTWRRIRLPIAQMYHVAVDNRIPYYVYGGMQDGDGFKGPSTSFGLRSGGWRPPNYDWTSTAGDECGFIVPDPVDPNIVWGGGFNASLTRIDYRTGFIHTVKVWPESSYGSSAGLLKYRFNWTFPITISPHDHNRVYAASQYVHVTQDKGRSWKVISPDLSLNNPQLMKPSGGLTKDNIGVEYGCIIFALAESRLEKGCIWAGTNDGLLHLTRNNGKKWLNLTGNIPNLPPLGTISNIEPSRYEAGTCYITVDFHQMNNRDPFIYKTNNYGKSWKLITNGIKKGVFSYIHWIHEDPHKKGLLYAGTENAIFISFNDGELWLPIQNNLPHAPVHHMVVQEHFNDLVVGTYGRGFWIMDDITPLQQLNGEVLKSEVYLFHPRPTYRMFNVTGGPRGNSIAYINYYIKKKISGKISLEIYDEQGQLVNTLKGISRKGINRVRWDLRYPAAKPARLRTIPPANPHVVEEKRFRSKWKKEGWFPILSWGTFGGFRGFRVAPGRYTVKLLVNDKEYSRSLIIKKDPRSAGTVADIKEQVKMQLAVRSALTKVSDMINSIEWMRSKLIDLAKNPLKRKKSAKIKRAALLLEKRLKKVEDKILQPVLAEGDSKSFRFPNLLYCKMSVLAGDLSQLVDYAPNQQQKEVFLKLKQQLKKYQGELGKIIKKQLLKFNNLLKKKKIAEVIIPK